MHKTKTILLAFLLLNGSFNLIAQEAKNVLFIAVDDLKPLLNCYGESQIYSPNIDKLANSGTVFLNNHCQQAVCAPSRASLLTGLRPDNTKVWDLHTIMRDYVPNVLTMPQYFRQKGYETVAFGKIFDPRSVDKDLDKLSWSIPYKSVNTSNFPEKFGVPFAGRWQLKETKEKAEYFRNEALNKGLKGKKANDYALMRVKPSTEIMEGPDEIYTDGQIAKNAIAQMKKLAKQRKPFFFAVGFHKPHLPFTAPKKYWDLYERGKIELSRWQKIPENGPEIAMHNWGELKSYSDIKQHIKADGLLDNEKQAELIHGYFACVSFIDAQIGKLLDELKQLGLDKNTVIVLWGDHGWHLGDHGLWCKHSNFEQATRSPLIFADPTITGSQKNSSPTEFVDIFPTLCELCRIETPARLEGKSLVPIMQGEQNQVKEFAISQYPRGKDIMGYALRNNRYRYVEWYSNNYRSYKTWKKENIIASELYDYKTDPDETHNLVNAKDYQEIKQSLSVQLHTFLQNKASGVK